MVILENIDIDKAILQNIDIDKISNRFKFGISNRARCSGMMMRVDVELEVVEVDECVEMRMQVDVDIS